MPVQFTYKGESEFTTTTGGIITIITSLLIFFYGGQQILFLFIQPDYSETMTTTYIDFNTNIEKISMDTEFTTVASRVYLFNSDESTMTPDEMVRISF